MGPTCCPSARVCDPIIMVFIPDEHTLLMVVQIVFVGRPPNMAACRAGAWPSPADTTFPMYTSSTSEAAIPARLTTASIAIPPNWVAESEESVLWKLPMGVRVAATMNTSWILRELYDRAADTHTFWTFVERNSLWDYSFLKQQRHATSSRAKSVRPYICLLII